MQNLNVRRVVTGHDENGNAIVKIDDTITGKKIADEAEFAMIWSTDAFPSDNTDEFDGSQREIHRTSPGGTVLQFLNMYPGKKSKMHRTKTLDYGIVLEGEITLELENGVEATMKAGDVIVQRGTIHAWHNKTDKICRLAFILLDAQEISVGNQILEPVN
ncbi:cupin domain-containing protein [Neobacillus niacini]|uniref:cupin domain-containing protein n=1 Tax=Neobacillus niacini TaxID=86668 RepID=UPI003001CA76